MSGAAGDVVVTDLHKSFRTLDVLRGVTLTVPAGSFTALLGPSGSGKTTLLRILAGFERPDRGTVAVGDEIFDDATTHVRPERRRVGYVSQDGSLFPHLTVRANVAFGMDRSQRRGPTANDLLSTVGLADVGSRYPHELSGGQQQRVALARALAVEPTLVLLDEPFAALDDNLRQSVRADVRRILRSSGATTVLVTHDQDEALSLADHVAVLRAGAIAQFASPDDLYTCPADAELATLVGDANLVDGLVNEVVVVTPFGPLHFRSPAKLHTRDRVTVLIRPEQLRVHSQLEGPGATGRVSETRFHGHDVLVTVITDELGNNAPVVARVLGGVTWPLDTRVRLTVDGGVVAWPDS